MTPEQRLAELASGENPALVLRLSSGFVVMGASQFLPGYCLLLAYPQVGQLNDLPQPGRMQFLGDMALLGEAVQAATGCKRTNYAIYGNLDPFLHAHVWPRYDREEEAYRTLPPLQIPPGLRDAPEAQFDPVKHGELLRRIRLEVLSRLSSSDED